MVSFSGSCNAESRNFLGFLICGQKSDNPIESDALVLSRRSSAIIPFDLFFEMFVTFQNKFDRKLGKRDQDFCSSGLNWEFPLLKLVSY